MSSLLTAFFAQVAIISYRSYQGGIQIPAEAPVNGPLPASYASAIIVYGALALVPSGGQKVAGMVGWGFVVATLLNLWNPSGGVNKANGTGPATYQQATPTANPNAGTQPATPGNIVFAPRSTY